MLSRITNFASHFSQRGEDFQRKNFHHRGVCTRVHRMEHDMGGNPSRRGESADGRTSFTSRVCRGAALHHCVFYSARHRVCNENKNSV